MARLLFRDSQGREGTVELTPAETVYVGRGLECAIRTDDGLVSRRHSQIRMENGRFVIEDLGSANGTHLNNTRIQKQALGHADVIQCGSLMIRFVDEGGVNVVPQPLPQSGTPPAKKGGTMVLDRGDTPEPLPNSSPPFSPSAGSNPPPSGGFQPVAGYVPPSGPAPSLPYGGPPQMPQGMFGQNRGGGFGGSAVAASGATPNPFGGPPAMPTANPNLPYGGPPAMPERPAPNLPYGGPPAMPLGGTSTNARSSDPSMFGRGGPAGAVAQSTPKPDGENKVLVDLGLQFDPSKADGEIKSLRAELEKQSSAHDREVADGKRVRAEAATLRERIEELRAQIKDRDEQVTAHDRVADELRDELQQTRDELARMRNDLGEMAENLAARERQAARAVDDTSKIREDMEDLNRQLMELSRTKDEGWKKLNDQLTEIEHLREVINEQERMLEERRVGLISQEEVIKELRADKEKTFKVIAQLKAERDEAATSSSRMAAQIVALEEENKRLGRMMVEGHNDSSRGGSGDQLMHATNELKDLRVELKKVEADRERLAEQYEAADKDRAKLEGRLAKLEVENQELGHGKTAAESARNVAQDALAKAEVARHKAAEESLASAKARDQASTGGDDARRELDRLRRKVADFEAKASAAPAAVDPAEVQREREAGERKLKEAVDNAQAFERSMKALQAEVDAAKTDAAKARAEAARARASADAQAEAVVMSSSSPAVPSANGDLQKAAREVYEAINDILSEMRNNMVLVQTELPNLKSTDTETMQAVTDAIEALVGSAENAKGSLRQLRDLSETK